jgi:hypothetical protein
MEATNKPLLAIIEPSINGCSIYFKDYPNISSWGTTIKETKQNFDFAIKELLETSKQEELIVMPPAILTEYVIDYKFNLQTILNYFSAINISYLAVKSGIDGGLMHQYKKGLAYASEFQCKCIETCFHQIGQELLDISL